MQSIFLEMDLEVVVKMSKKYFLFFFDAVRVDKRARFSGHRGISIIYEVNTWVLYVKLLVSLNVKILSFEKACTFQ